MDTYNHTLIDTAVTAAVETPLVGWAGVTRRDPRPGPTDEYLPPAAPYPPNNYLAEARRDAEMQRAMNTVHAEGGGIGQGIGQKGWCTGDSHFYACKHETVCTCGKTGRITVAPGL